MQAAARIGISMTISQVGSDLHTAGIPTTMFPINRTNDWQPAFTLDKDGVLHQLRATLVQAIDASFRTLFHPLLLIYFFYLSIYLSGCIYRSLLKILMVLPIAAKLPLANLQQPPQQNHSIPVMQQCVDAITEYQKLHSLMKGELV